ncbi:MAG: aspartate aminotransferase family protein, partial [Anaerolineae bacterium]|nr:aspartate aminotransferase family protein [Anaerolineae bacterium]
GGVLTVSVGHCNDEITERTIEQFRRVQHTSTLYVNPVMVDVAEMIASKAPGRLQKLYFTNSGTEANETAIIAARMYTGSMEIITLRHAYSGRTQAAMSLTAHGNWRIGGVTDPYIRHVKNPYTYRFPANMTEDEIVDYCIADLEEVIATLTNGKIAAFMAEPIQGVGGFITPPPTYFKRAYDIIKKHGGLFISDEVQTAWTRTGQHWFGIEHWGVEPDIITSAKGLGNGSPVGVTIATPEVADALKGTTFSTFGGNPVTMAATLGTLKYIDENNLVQHTYEQGQVLMQKLEELQSEFPFVGEVRGKGLMTGMEIVVPDGSKTPDAARTAQIINVARKHGLLIGKGGLHGNVVRITPHLNIDPQDMLTGMELLGRALADVSK